MDIITAYATQNPCYVKGDKLTPVGIVVHSTGANNPNLKRYVDSPAACGKNEYGNHWNTPTTKVCVHSFIGYDKDKNVCVANILPYNMACWGVGKGSKGSYNYDPVGHIQFEMCEDDLSDKAYFNAVWGVAVEYCAELCKAFSFDPLKEGVIVSHKEAHTLGYGSNHGDPDHWFKIYGKTMDDFRAAVSAKMGAVPSPTPAKIAAGDTVTITGGYYYGGQKIPSWVKADIWIVESVSGDRVVINKNLSGRNAIMSPVKAADLTQVKANKTMAVAPTSGLWYHRAYPCTTHTRVGVWKQGAKVEVIEGWTAQYGSHTWGKVLYNGAIVFCAVDYLK